MLEEDFSWSHWLKSFSLENHRNETKPVQSMWLIFVLYCPSSIYFLGWTITLFILTCASFAIFEQSYKRIIISFPTTRCEEYLKLFMSYLSYLYLIYLWKSWRGLAWSYAISCTSAQSVSMWGWQIDLFIFKRRKD